MANLTWGSRRLADHDGLGDNPRAPCAVAESLACALRPPQTASAHPRPRRFHPAAARPHRQRQDRDALALAHALPVEVISVDSALVYRDMDIGTAKAERGRTRGVPAPPDRRGDARRATPPRAFAPTIRLMGEIVARGNIPLLAAAPCCTSRRCATGSPTCRGRPRAAPRARRRDRRRGWRAARRSRLLDPEAAGRPGDAQRIQRALEIVRLTGRPLADSYAKKEDDPAALPAAADRASCAPRTVGAARASRNASTSCSTPGWSKVRQLRAHATGSTRPCPSMRCVGYRQVGIPRRQHRLRRAALQGHRRHPPARQAPAHLAARQFRETWPGFVELDCLRPDLPEAVLHTALRLHDLPLHPA